MSYRVHPTVFLVLGLASIPIIAAQYVRADSSYPTQGNQTFRTDGVVTMVDADRDRVGITTSDGRQYNLDTDNTEIKLRTSTRPGDTGDLATGMHVEVTGRLLSKDIVAVDHLTVLPFEGAPRGSVPAHRSDPEPEPEPAPAPQRPTAPIDAHGDDAPPAPVHAQRIRLRGSVENVDDENGVVVVRVNTHLRTILVDHDTDLTDVPSPDDNHIGLRSGDRVTVVGQLRGDGDVKASVISLSKDAQPAQRTADTHGDAPPVVDNPHQLVGRISHKSDPMLSRDIKVRSDEGRDITVHVPHDAKVQRNGIAISVHELTGDDVVRVIGAYDSDDGDFKATRIDVLQAYQDEQ